MSLKGRDVISTCDLSSQDFSRLFEEAEELRVLFEKGPLNVARSRIMATLFFEPSTRTRLSFTYAMAKLGGQVVDFGPKDTTSVVKGETLSDTIRIINGYDADLIVLRHGLEGASRLASEITRVPVVNAGDGSREHPTQALTDLYTIWKALGRIDGITVGILGDLKYGRTPTSLSYSLSMFKGVKIFFIAPDLLQIRGEVTEKIKGNVDFESTNDLRSVLGRLDVLYVTRIQKERFPDMEEYLKVKGTYRIDGQLLRESGASPLILHPLPRVDEISMDVDELPNAKYFEQAANGVIVRAALIAEIMGLEI